MKNCSLVDCSCLYLAANETATPLVPYSLLSSSVLRRWTNPSELLCVGMRAYWFCIWGCPMGLASKEAKEAAGIR